MHFHLYSEELVKQGACLVNHKSRKIQKMPSFCLFEHVTYQRLSLKGQENKDFLFHLRSSRREFPPGDSAAPKGLAVSEVVAEEDEVTLRSGERLSPHCSHIQPVSF